MTARFLIALLMAAICSLPITASAADDGATVYKIRNRWLKDQFLHASDGKVGYGTGDDATYRWTVEQVGGYQRIKNADTGACMTVKEGAADVELAAAPAATDAAGQWTIDYVSLPFRAIKSRVTGKYVNCEHKLGRVECDTDKTPTPMDVWSAQWEFVQVGGPPPLPFVQRGRIAVTSPAYGSDVKGDTPLALVAAGFETVTVKCWQQGDGFGTDSTVGEVKPDAQGKGSIVFPAEKYPHGPITVRISGADGKVKDNCYLQLYNKGGVSWNEGMPKDPPPAAAGLALVFAEDFTGPLSISSTDPKATFYDHKPPNGSQDFSTLTFSGYDSPKNPFAQVDSYLRIRASEKTHSSGLLSSMKNDAGGLKVSVPCYFEARFIGPNAIGTWPAFWLMTDYMTDYRLKGDKTPCDELDIIEAYGGEGPHEPNAGDTYMICPHCWNQGAEGKAIEKKAYEGMHNPIHMRKAGIPSTWFEAFHVYGCKITETDTIYYCDNIEVGRHATLPLSKERPFFFLINLATGGGWPVNLSRYDGQADMYVDYVRVYSGAGGANRVAERRGN